MANLNAVVGFMKEAFQDNNKASFSRLFSVPFLFGSFCLSAADGVMSLVRHHSALDAAGSMAMMGIALFTGSKALSIRGQRFTGQMGGGDAPAPIPETKPEG